MVLDEYTLADAYFPFHSSSWYQAGDYFGSPAVFITAYFVDPADKLADCQSGGRTQEEFDAQGTGYALFFQVRENAFICNV